MAMGWLNTAYRNKINGLSVVYQFHQGCGLSSAFWKIYETRIYNDISLCLSIVKNIFKMKEFLLLGMVAQVFKFTHFQLSVQLQFSYSLIRKAKLNNANSSTNS